MAGTRAARRSPGEHDSARQPSGSVVRLGMSDTADRLDDVGIGILAAPYAAGVLGNLTSHVPRLARVSHAAHAFHDAFPKFPSAELAGLALVAPGIVHPLAEKIDAMSDKTAAYLDGYVAAHAALGLV